MGLFDFFKNKNDLENATRPELLHSNQVKLFENYFSGLQNRTAFKMYALQLCINRISNALVKCDFKTLDLGKTVKGQTWYQLNVEPNQNQNAADFWNKVVYQMVMNENGALVIQSPKTGELLAADSFMIQEFAFKPNVYSSIYVNNYMIKSIYREQDVFHLRLNNSKVKRIFDEIYKEYENFLDGAIKNYNRSNALKFALQMDTTFDQFKQKPLLDENGKPVVDADGVQLTEYDSIIDDLFENRFKSIFGEKDSITPLESGLSLNDLNATGNSKSSGSAANKTTRDISSIVEEMIDICADAFAIPRGLLHGDTADAETMTDNFITFCINPLAEQIEDEINRKLYGKDSVINRTYCRVETSKIRNSDITKLATTAELLSRIGGWSINDILVDLMDQEPIQEDWANQHIISKNYALVEELKGGDNSEETDENNS